ncbi:MAG: hypothetical protein QM775_30730 [Pirellulales bacterium]
MRQLFIFAAVLGFCLPPAEGAAAEKPLWFFVQTDLRDRDITKGKLFHTQEVLDLMRDAKSVGYEGMILSDYGFGRLIDVDGMFDHMRQVRELAHELDVKIMPTVMPVGASGSILMNGADLAEGLPVRNLPMKVSQGRLVTADTTNLMGDAGFESDEPGEPNAHELLVGGWTIDDQDADVVTRSTVEKHGGVASLAFQNFPSSSDNFFARHHATLTEYRQYRLSFWIKTTAFSGGVQVVLNPQGNRLVDRKRIFNLPVEETANWMQASLAFNPLATTEWDIGIGVVGTKAGGGAIHFDDVELVAMGPSNLLHERVAKSSC